MLGNQILQKILADISRIIKEDCSVWSAEGKCLAATSDDNNNLADDVAILLADAEDTDVRISDKGACFVVRHKDEVMYVFAIHNMIDNIAVMGELCVSQFENVMHIYEKRVDRNHFFQQLILDNMLLVDVHSQAKKMNLEVNDPRIVFVVEQKKKGDSLLLDTMKAIFDNGNKDVVTSVDESHIILIKTLAKADGYVEVSRIAKTIVDTLSMEAMVQVRVASTNSPWLAGVEVGDVFSVPISHGEGKFVASPELIDTLAANGQIMTQYVDLEGRPTMDVRFNPNGSAAAIEGILSPNGRVFGKMGHAERYANGLYRNVPGNYDMALFKSAVKYFK